MMIKIKQLFRRIIVFLKLHKYSSLIVAVALIAAAAYLFTSLGENISFEAPKTDVKKKAPKDERVRAPLTGVLVNPDLAKRRPQAVVIENSPEARPQSGLDKASLVLETYAEGGITRMLAIFQENDAQEIGPVRSARVQFVNWANEYNAVFAHVGGSQAALNLIPSVGVLDFNQFFNGSYFWRDNTRFAPHNVYTTTDKLRQGGESRGYSKEKEIEPFKFKDENKVEERGDVLEVNIPFSGPTFAVKYVYNKESNSYLRHVAGRVDKDKPSGKEITAKNIIIQRANVVDRAGLDTQVEAIGSGAIEYYMDGKKFEGKWSKANSSSRTKYLDSDGNEILLNPGQTWIEVTRR